MPAAFVACLGCSDAVKLIQDTETGGVVTYLFAEERGGAMDGGAERAAQTNAPGRAPEPPLNEQGSRHLTKSDRRRSGGW